MFDPEKSQKTAHAFFFFPFDSEVILSREALNEEGLVKISDSFRLLNRMH